MLKYSDLTKGQKKTIDAYVAHRPELATAETLASKDINIIWNELCHLFDCPLVVLYNCLLPNQVLILQL
jgi:hypothetical protein